MACLTIVLAHVEYLSDFSLHACFLYSTPGFVSTGTFAWQEQLLHKYVLLQTCFKDVFKY